MFHSPLLQILEKQSIANVDQTVVLDFDIRPERMCLDDIIVAILTKAIGKYHVHHEEGGALGNEVHGLDLLVILHVKRATFLFTQK